jgi:hypothetical protein
MDQAWLGALMAWRETALDAAQPVTMRRVELPPSHQLVDQFLLQLAAVTALGHRGLLHWRGHDGYAEGLFAAWLHDPGPHTWEQRWGLACQHMSARGTRESVAAHRALSGEFTPLGPGALMPLTEAGAAWQIPSALWAGLLGEGGLWSQRPPHLSPEMMIGERWSPENWPGPDVTGEAWAGLAAWVRGVPPGEPLRRAIHAGIRWRVTDEVQHLAVRLRWLLLLVESEPEFGGPLPDLRPLIAVDPQPWASEDASTEFKATWEWDVRQEQKSPALRFGVLRSVAGFLNGAGGTLWLGVNDAGEPIGLPQDLALIKESDPQAREDTFLLRLHEAFKVNLRPHPVGFARGEWVSVRGQRVVRVAVRAVPGPGVTLKDPKSDEATVYVRDGNRTIALRDDALVAWQTRRATPD